MVNVYALKKKKSSVI